MNEYRNKAEFVRKLGELLNEHTNHRTGVVEMIYQNNNDFETVQIIFDNGNSRTVNVTGDSELAIMYDVYKYLI
jgi:hypothetical protein